VRNGPSTTRAPTVGERSLAKPAPDARRDEVRGLLEAYREAPTPAARERLVELNQDLVRFIARRFANRGEPVEDIEQVGFLGLINAIERFDPAMGNEFSTFATPTIMGEIRRHFRDRSWAIRVPRRLQENYGRVMRAAEALRLSLGREPSVAEIGVEVALEQEDVLAALEVAPAQHTLSLEGPGIGSADDDTRDLASRLGHEDANLERVETAAVLGHAMAQLTPRERKIMALRFVDQLSQTEVAERLGISQMHVSRLQRAALDHLRADLAELADPGAEPPGSPGGAGRIASLPPRAASASPGTL